jgi:alkylation response protein AidB-like acyl-CoA dehydrogenase
MSSEQSSKSVDLSPWAEPLYLHGLPSPYYKQAHYAYQNALRTYINTNVLPYWKEWEEAGAAPREAMLDYARSGFAFSDVPKAYRPDDLPKPGDVDQENLDAFHLLISTDEVSRVEGGVMNALGGGSIIGVPPIIAHGTEEQKKRWLPGLFEYSTSFSLGITEPGAGSDVGGIETTATKSVDGKTYIVNGYKKWITGTPVATHMTTAVRTGEPGIGGISMLVIPMNAKGVAWRRIENSGQKAGGASFIELDNVEVPIENLLGKPNDGFRIIVTNFNRVSRINDRQAKKLIAVRRSDM